MPPPLVSFSSPTAAGEARGHFTGYEERKVPMKFTVGLKAKGKVSHVVIDAEDALIAALRTKAEHPDVQIMYVRPQNRRGDTRHPPLLRAKAP